MTNDRPILLMTRPTPQSRAFIDGLDPGLLGQVETIISPLLRIRVLEAPIQADRPAGVIFTSVNGVRAATELGLAPSGPAFCVGPATAEAAQQAGWAAHPAGHNADTLVAALIADPPQAPLLHVCGRHVRGQVAERLTQAGIATDAHVAYDQVAQSFTKDALAAFAGPQPIIAPVFSPRTAEIFAKDAPRHRADIVAISAAAADPFRLAGYSDIVISQAPNAESLRACVEKQLHLRVSG